MLPYLWNSNDGCTSLTVYSHSVIVQNYALEISMKVKRYPYAEL